MSAGPRDDPGRRLRARRRVLGAATVVAFGVAFGVAAASAGEDVPPTPRSVPDAVIVGEESSAAIPEPGRLGAVAGLPEPPPAPPPRRAPRLAPPVMVSEPVVPTSMPSEPAAPAPAPAPAETFDSLGGFDSSGSP